MSWCVSTQLFYLIPTIVVVSMLKSFHLFEKSDSSLVFLFFFMYSVSLTLLVLCISAFLGKSRTSGLHISLFNTIGLISSLLVLILAGIGPGIETFEPPYWIRVFVSLISPFAFHQGTRVILNLEDIRYFYMQ